MKKSVRTDYQIATDALKIALKKQRLTYRDVAKTISLSESGVKKILSASDGSFQRLVEIARVAGLTISDLVQGSGESTLELHYNQKQQEFLTSDVKALHFYWSLVYERNTLAESLAKIQCEQKEGFSLLRKMDHLGLLALLPGGRVRVPSVRPVKWAGDGPLLKKLYREWSQKMIRELARPDISTSALFTLRYFKLKPATYQDLLTSMRHLETEFNRRAIQDMRTGSPDLIHLRWLMAADSKSFIDDEK